MITEDPFIKIYSFRRDYGRMGSISGLFAVRERGEQILQALLARKATIYLGEVLGKHSDVRFTMEEKDFKVRSEDPADVATVLRVLGCESSPRDLWVGISGRNILSSWDGELSWQYRGDPDADYHAALLRESLENGAGFKPERSGS